MYLIYIAVYYATISYDKNGHKMDENDEYKVKFGGKVL